MLCAYLLLLGGQAKQFKAFLKKKSIFLITALNSTFWQRYNATKRQF